MEKIYSRLEERCRPKLWNLSKVDLNAQLTKTVTLNATKPFLRNKARAFVNMRSKKQNHIFSYSMEFVCKQYHINLIKRWLSITTIDSIPCLCRKREGNWNGHSGDAKYIDMEKPRFFTAEHWQVVPASSFTSKLLNWLNK